MKFTVALTFAASMVTSPLMAEIWFQDLDADGYGNADVSVEADTQPLGYVLNNIDCDDSDIDIYNGCGLLLGNSQGTAALAGVGALLVMGAVFGSGGSSTNATSGTN